MKAALFEERRGEYLLSTDPAKVDIEQVGTWLNATYWAKGMPLDLVKRAAENSLCFSIYKDKTQVGFARVVTDLSTYGYLTDVVIDEAERGKGHSKWLVTAILAHPDLQGFRRMALMTWDAQSLYAQFGFGPLEDPTRYMEIYTPDTYTRD